MNLMEASNQWRSRPDDERFVSLLDLQAYSRKVKQNSAGRVLANRDLKVAPVTEFLAKVDQTPTQNGLVLVGKANNPVVPTHWAFGQLCQRAGAPAGYFRDSELPAPLVADCINWGLLRRDVESLGILLRKDTNGETIVTAAAVTGPDYGRIWNADVVDELIGHFGDGVTGKFRVPGEFGVKVDITKANTTIFGNDVGIFVFLADEDNRIEIPNRRAGKFGGFARGFFVKNSEVGGGMAEFWGFLYDYTCCNRIIWNVEDIQKIQIRHTKGGPHRWMEEITPVLNKMAASSPKGIKDTIEEARKDVLGDKVMEFLANRFTRSQAKAMMEIHMLEEHRPIETRWDAVVGISAFAKTIRNADDRVKVERAAGMLIEV